MIGESSRICVQLVTLDRLGPKVYSDTMTLPMKKSSRPFRFKACLLCNSPYRYQIENAWTSGVERKAIYEHFAPLTGHDTLRGIEAACYRHFGKKHFEEAKKYVSLDKPKDSPHAMSRTTLDELAQGLMDIGGDMVKFYKDNPLVARKELRIGEIMKAQDSVTNRMKVQVTQDALKLQMAKMFGGFLSDTVEEGELVDEDPPTALLPEN